MHRYSAKTASSGQSKIITWAESGALVVRSGEINYSKHKHSGVRRQHSLTHQIEFCFFRDSRITSSLLLVTPLDVIFHLPRWHRGRFLLAAAAAGVLGRLALLRGHRGAPQTPTRWIRAVVVLARHLYLSLTLGKNVN
jgi:hypothetical protein